MRSPAAESAGGASSGPIRAGGHVAQCRGGRKRIVATDGSYVVPNSKPQPDGTLIKAVARAWRWQRMPDEGVYATVSEIGDAENISRSYVSRILRLALLAPDIVEAILAGSMDQGVMLEQLEGPLPSTGRSSGVLYYAGEMVDYESRMQG